MWVAGALFGRYAYADGDETETKIGAWSMPPSEDGQPDFWTPPGCEGQAVMHTNAALKHYHTEFHFQPPQDVGAIAFRALLKQGETNGGSFFWPAEPLTLRPAGTVAWWVWLVVALLLLFCLLLVLLLRKLEVLVLVRKGAGARSADATDGLGTAAKKGSRKKRRRATKKKTKKTKKGTKGKSARRKDGSNDSDEEQGDAPTAKRAAHP